MANLLDAYRQKADHLQAIGYGETAGQIRVLCDCVDKLLKDTNPPKLIRDVVEGLLREAG